MQPKSIDPLNQLLLITNRACHLQTQTHSKALKHCPNQMHAWVSNVRLNICERASGYLTYHRKDILRYTHGFLPQSADSFSIAQISFGNLKLDIMDNLSSLQDVELSVPDPPLLALKVDHRVSVTSLAH